MDIGLAFDGDADRCLAVDSDGNLVDGDVLIAIAALDMKKRGKLKNEHCGRNGYDQYGILEICRTKRYQC